MQNESWLQVAECLGSTKKVCSSLGAVLHEQENGPLGDEAAPVQQLAILARDSTALYELLKAKPALVVKSLSDKMELLRKQADGVLDDVTTAIHKECTDFLAACMQEMEPMVVKGGTAGASWLFECPAPRLSNHIGHGASAGRAQFVLPGGLPEQSGQCLGDCS